MSTHPLRAGACPDPDSTAFVTAFFCKPSPTNLFGQSASLEHCDRIAEPNARGAKTKVAIKSWRPSGPWPKFSETG